MTEKWSAIILAGGLGSRLMPLTTDICKPMVSVTNKPMIDYAIDHLRYAGIKKIIVCVKVFGDLLTETLLERWKPVMDAEPDFELLVPKNESKGTADAVRKIWDLIDTEHFIVSMADILTNLPMKKFMDFHIEKDADSTISMKTIDEFATKYGNTIIDDDGRIELFMEKPSAQEIFISSLTGARDQDILPIINTGIYCFKRKIAHQAIMETNFMDFGKDIFPFMLENKYGLYGFVDKYYWMDVGNPKTYLWANWDILREYGWPILPLGEQAPNGRKIWWKTTPILPESSKIEERVCLGENINFGENVKIGALSVIGNNVKIGNGTIIERSVIWDDVEIGDNCQIIESVVSNGVKIGSGSVIRTDTVLGPCSIVGDKMTLDSRTLKAKEILNK